MINNQLDSRETTLDTGVNVINDMVVGVVHPVGAVIVLATWNVDIAHDLFRVLEDVECKALGDVPC